MERHETVAVLERELRARYRVGPADIRVIMAPYRICPLGAHIDHQLGTVTALALDQGAHLAFAPTDAPEVRLSSLSYPGEVHFRLDDIPPRQAGDWGNYARGAAQALSRLGPLARGIVGVTHGDLAEVGLSSSASIGVAYLLALEQVNGLAVSPTQNIRLDQAIENQYLGLNNGILDQSAILLSRRDHLTLIDCRLFALETESPGTPDVLPSAGGAMPPGIRLLPKPAAMQPVDILIAFSGLTQAVIATDYNRRVAECAEAARGLLAAAGRPGARPVLAEVSLEEYTAHRSRLSGAPARRAEHFFSEMRRVEGGVQAWEKGDVEGVGRLMTESGESSITHYECGSRPLIDLYDLLIRAPGVFGARFSGAGFRGCCVALAEPVTAQAALPEIQEAYATRQPDLAARASFFLCQSGDGARML